jgi:hypothetical protein
MTSTRYFVLSLVLGSCALHLTTTCRGSNGVIVSAASEVTGYTNTTVQHTTLSPLIKGQVQWKFGSLNRRAVLVYAGYMCRSFAAKVWTLTRLLVRQHKSETAFYFTEQKVTSKQSCLFLIFRLLSIKKKQT